MFLVPHGPTLVHGASDRCNNGLNKKCQKESKYPLLPTISVLPLCSQSLETIQPLATRAEAWQAISGVSEWIMATIRRGYSLQFAQRPPLPLLRCGRHHSAQRGRSSPARRGDESAGKGSHRSHSSSPERVRLLQLLLPHPQKRRWPATYSRSQTPESRPDKKVVQDDHTETDPLENTPRGLMHVAGSERRILSHPGSPHHRRFLRFAFEGVAYQYKVLPFGLSLAPRTLT